CRSRGRAHAAAMTQCAPSIPPRLLPDESEARVLIRTTVVRLGTAGSASLQRLVVVAADDLVPGARFDPLLRIAVEILEPPHVAAFVADCPKRSASTGRRDPAVRVVARGSGAGSRSGVPPLVESRQPIRDTGDPGEPR